MTSNQPTEPSQTPPLQQQAATQPEPEPERRLRWNTPELWAMIVTVLVLVPATIYASRIAVDAGVPYWVTAVVFTVIAVASYVAYNEGSGKIRDGVLFGVWINFLMAAIGDSAEALDTSFNRVLGVLLAVVAVFLVGRYARNQRREKSV